MLVVAGLTVPLLGRGMQARPLAIWMGILLTLLLARYATALQAERALHSSRDVLRAYDNQFLLLSVLSQAVVGAGIWLVPASADAIAPYVMTMLLAIYAVGTMVNLAHDFRSLRASLPLLLLQPIAFWLMRGIEGILIAVIFLGITWIMLSSSQNSMRAFVDSIRIRFDKDDLLGRLEQEKQATQEALQAAEEANRAKSFFMAAASHDLRQPLYAATLLNDTLALHDLPDGAGEVVAKQREALAAATGLFDNLLDLSKFESGVIQPTLNQVPLARVFEQMDTEFRAMAEAKGLAFRADTDPPDVRSDFDLLTRMLRNLLSNAVRYTQEGRIQLGWRWDGDRVRISVADTGVGIPEHEHERVFQEFQQLDNPHRSRDKGVGLGLAIVRHISELLDHPIELQSAPGRGTRFEVIVPTGRQTAAARLPRSARVSADAALLQNRTAWVVEDDALVSEALGHYLGRQGCAHYRARTRQEILELEQRHGLPDFVILDDMLGGAETGLDLAQWLAGKLPRERILLTTGNAALERWEILQRSGLRVMRKPVGTTALSEWLVEALDAAREPGSAEVRAAD